MRKLFLFSIIIVFLVNCEANVKCNIKREVSTQPEKDGFLTNLTERTNAREISWVEFRKLHNNHKLLIVDPVGNTRPRHGYYSDLGINDTTLVFISLDETNQQHTLFVVELPTGPDTTGTLWLLLKPWPITLPSEQLNSLVKLIPTKRFYDEHTKSGLCWEDKARGLLE